MVHPLVRCLLVCVVELVHHEHVHVQSVHVQYCSYCNVHIGAWSAPTLTLISPCFASLIGIMLLCCLDTLEAALVHLGSQFSDLRAC